MTKIKETDYVDSIKLLTLDILKNSKDKDICLSSATLFYTLIKNHLKFDLERPFWANRDRFVITDSRVSSLYYATLFFMTNDYTLEDIKKYQHLGSNTPYNLELDINKRVEITTGVSSLGLATSVGMAMASKHLEEVYNDKKITLFDYYVYCYCTNDTILSGEALEAIILAGSNKLDNLVVFYNYENKEEDDEEFKELVVENYLANDFEVLEVKNNNSIKEIDKAIISAQKSDVPVLIILNSSKEEFNINELRESLEVTKEYEYNTDIIKNNKLELQERISDYYQEWYQEYKEYCSVKTNKEKSNLVNYLNNENINLKLDKIIKTDKIPIEKSMNYINYQVINIISTFAKNFLGGSTNYTDTMTYLKNKKEFNSDNYDAKNINFKNYKSIMGSVMNGYALASFRPFVGAKLIEVDRLKPSIRDSAMMNLPVTYIFTHDTLISDSKGMAFEPVEQLAMLRSIPNLEVYRPCDYKELLGCWNKILEDRKPSAIIISNHPTETFKYTSVSEVEYGGYVISEVKNRLDLIIMASGSEVTLAMKLKQELLKNYIEARVVTVPNLNLFLKQDIDYKNQVLPKGYKKVALEFSNDNTWYQLINSSNDFINITDFGKSGTKEELYEYFELDIANIIIKIKNNL